MNSLKSKLLNFVVLNCKLLNSLLNFYYMNSLKSKLWKFVFFLNFKLLYSLVVFKISIQYTLKLVLLCSHFFGAISDRKPPKEVSWWFKVWECQVSSLFFFHFGFAILSDILWKAYIFRTLWFEIGRKKLWGK